MRGRKHAPRTTAAGVGAYEDVLGGAETTERPTCTSLVRCRKRIGRPRFQTLQENASLLPPQVSHYIQWLSIAVLRQVSH